MLDGLFSSRVIWVAGPLKSEKLGDYSYQSGLSEATISETYGHVQSLTIETRELLQPFINMGGAIAM